MELMDMLLKEWLSKYMNKADKKSKKRVNIDMNTKVQVSYSSELDFLPPVAEEAYNKIRCLSCDIRFNTF